MMKSHRHPASPSQLISSRSPDTGEPNMFVSGTAAMKSAVALARSSVRNQWLR